MALNKVRTYIGFCIKSGKISRGVNAIESIKSGVYLLIMDSSAAKNSVKSAISLKNKFSCPLIVCKSGFETDVNYIGCRLAAIRDEGLAKAILDNLGENYELYSGGME